MILKVLSIILPIFILILLGFLCRVKGLLSISTGKELNKFIFYISLPALLICKISQADINITDQWGAYLSILLATAVVAFLGIFLSTFFGLLSSQKWVCAHGCIRSNMAFIGLPVIIYATNDKGASIAALLMGLTIPIYNIIGVVFLTLGKKRTEAISVKSVLIQIGWSILKNPLIWGCLIGGILYLIKINKTTFLIKNLESIGYISIPLSLICMGIQMNKAINWQRLKQVMFPTILKLIACPAFGLLFLHLFYANPDQNMVLSVLVLLGCPSAVASYVMAVEMNADPEFAADMVLSTTLLSFFTISGILLLIQYL